jgi:hypothetical protein
MSSELLRFKNTNYKKPEYPEETSYPAASHWQTLVLRVIG